MLAALLVLSSVSLWAAAPRLTPAAAGPYRVRGNRIVDAKGLPYLMRGTELPVLTLRDADIAGDGREFGPFSASSFVSIRHRLNMNAVRLPVSPLQYAESGAYRARAAEVVRGANRFELVVILAADPGESAPAGFWARCAGDFKSFPNVFFAPGHGEDTVETIRASGAEQPVIVDVEFQGRGANLVYQAAPSYATTRTDEDRWKQFGALSEQAPVLVNDMDPQLDRAGGECAAFPNDPGAATKLVQENLAYFDAHEISWVLSSFRPGKMLTEYRYYNWSKLDDGWTCGEVPPRSGIAMVLAAHLWNVDPHGLFTVNHVNGGFVLARGGLATAYGPILAEQEATAPGGRPLPLRLSNVSVEVKDARGVARLARLVYTGFGWSDVAFIVPENSAPGPAEISIVRTDGSRSTGGVIIADVAPGFLTATSDARGPVVGEVVQEAKKFPAAECTAGNCRAVPIALSDKFTTTVRLAGSGIRHAGQNAAVRVTVGGLSVPVVSFGAADTVGRDQVTIRLPVGLKGVGETDLTMTVNGTISNVARIHCGGL